MAEHCRKPVDKQYRLQYTSRNATVVSLLANILKRMLELG
jgi:hypothetical protein